MNPVFLTLRNRSLLIAVPTDKFKSELLSLQFALPLDEGAQATSLLLSVLKRGTLTYPTRALLNRHLDEMYSTSVSFHSQRTGDMHALSLNADFLGARYVGGQGAGLLPQVIDVMAELLLAPATENGLLVSSFVEGEKANLRDAIRAAINSPRSLAIARCRALLCRDEPFARSLIGREETVSAHTADTLTVHHKALLGQLSPVFVYVGGTAPEEVAAMLEARFGAAFGDTPAYSALVKPHTGEVREKCDEMPLCQGKLALGFRGDISLSHRLAPALMLLNEIYGASPASKLFLNVRERHSLCYHCSSSLDLHKGVIIANAGMKRENRRVTEEAMLSEFEELARGGITEEELEAAHRSLEFTYRQVLDHPTMLANFYATRALVGRNETVDEWRERLALVTREDVIEAASHIALGAVYFLCGTLDGEEGEE